MGREGRCVAVTPIKTHIFPPLSLLYPATLLQENGFDITVFDGVVEKISEEELLKLTLDKNLIIINISPSTYNPDIELLKKIKEKNNAHVSSLGIFPTIKAEFLLKNGFDSVVRNESEFTILELAKALSSNQNLKAIKGLSYKVSSRITKREKIIHNQTREYLNIDNLPIPNRNLIDHKKYCFPFTNEPYTTILTNRGCPYNCIFCTAHILTGKRFRRRSVAHVLKEIKDILTTTKIRMIAFYADTFTLDKPFVIELCTKILEQGLKFKWACNSRVDTIDEEMLSIMHKAGCRYIFFGAESASQDILNTSKKNITVEQIENAVKLAKKAKIQTTLYFIFGLPYETRETVQKTIDFAIKLDPDYCYFSIATPYEGTEFYEIVKKKGHIVNDAPDNQFDAKVRTDELSNEDLTQILSNAYNRFYLRPTVFAKEFKKVVFNFQFKELRLAFDLIKWVFKS